MEIRQAFPNEIGAIMTVIESARTALAEAGSTQWQGSDGYPTEETIFDDVLNGQGIAQTFIQGLIEGTDAHDFRCDTHEKNTVMQHILEKLGYVYCGKVPIDGERLAYQKIKTKREQAFYQELDEAAHHGIH